MPTKPKPTTEPPRRRIRVPFELHRLAEYALALGLLTVALNDRGRHPALGVAGAVLLVMAATTRGRFGLRGWLSPGLHRSLDGAMTLATAAVPFVPGMGGLYAAQYLIPTAAMMAWLTSRTNHATSGGRVGKRRLHAVPAAAPPPVTRHPTPRAPRLEEPEGAHQVAARNLGRLAGRMVVAARRASRK